MEEVAMADCSHLVPRLPQRAEPQTLQLGRDDLHASSSLARGTEPTGPRSPPPDPLAQLLIRQQRRHPSSPPGSAVYALQSKVKALSAHRTVGQEVLRSGLDKRGSPAPVGLTSSSSDEDSAAYGSNSSTAELDVQMDEESLTGLDLSLLAFPRSLGEGSSLENLSDASCSTSSTASQVESSGTASPRLWIPPRGFWKAARPETLILNSGAPRSAADSPNPGAPGSLPRQEAAPGSICSEPQRSNSFEGHLRRFGRGNLELQGLAGCLWRDESPESTGSAGSSLSLAERVEMNRDILKQMLSGGPRNANLPNGCKIEGREGQTQAKNRGFLTLNDSDWDSGISLQDNEHNQRAFVSGEDLPLSPRHEQAKRLLERARMKARSFPLRADHTILPLQRDDPEPVFRPGARPSHQAPLVGKEGKAAPLSGNLSDSSSGDSACGGPQQQRRRPGQSPTRVRFEDETEKEAEIRYLERLRQRRRAGERAQGLLVSLLVSKPNLSAYVNGRKEAERTGASNGVLIEAGCIPDVWLQRPSRAPDSLAHNAAGGHYRTLPLQDLANRQCNSCGTILDGAVPNVNPYPDPSPSLQIIPINGEHKGKVAAPYWVPPSKPSLTFRTEPIKETYIGAVSPEADRKPARSAEEMTDSGDGDGGAAESGGVRVSAMRVKRRTKRAELTGVNGHVVPAPPEGIKPWCVAADAPSSTTGEVELPLNPYASERTDPPTQPHILLPSMEEALNDPLVLAQPKSEPSSAPLPMKSALKSRANGWLHSQQVVMSTPPPDPGGSPEDQGRGAAVNPQEELCAGGMPNETDPSTEGRDQAPSGTTGLTYSPSPSWSTGATASQLEPEPAVAQSQPGIAAASINNNPPPYKCGGDGRVRGPMRAERQSDDSPSPDLLVGTDSSSREGRSRLSLRRIFSAMGLSGAGKALGKGRSSSLDQLSAKSRNGPSQASPNPSQASGQLKKTPSLQSLRMGSPFLQVRKSSSVQSLQSAKKKVDRSSSYTPGPQPSSPALSRGLQRALSVEDVGCPSGVRSVGRVAQAFPDGTLLLELSRPPNGPFGFLISRGKGRTDSGVYVEEMGDSSTEKLYAGLLAVGDEILEVNGEKVAGLSLDLVTRLMTHDSTASVRVLRHRRLPPR